MELWPAIGHIFTPSWQLIVQQTIKLSWCVVLFWFMYVEEFAGFCLSISAHRPIVSRSGNRPGRHSSAWRPPLSALTVTDDGSLGWECVCINTRLVCCAEERLLQVGKQWARRDGYHWLRAGVRGHWAVLHSLIACLGATLGPFSSAAQRVQLCWWDGSVVTQWERPWKEICTQESWHCVAT